MSQSQTSDADGQDGSSSNIRVAIAVLTVLLAVGSASAVRFSSLPGLPGPSAAVDSVAAAVDDAPRRRVDFRVEANGTATYQGRPVDAALVEQLTREARARSEELDVRLVTPHGVQPRPGVVELIDVGIAAAGSTESRVRVQRGHPTPAAAAEPSE